MAQMTVNLGAKYPPGECKLCAADGKGIVSAWDGRATKCVAHLSEKERSRRGLSLPDGAIPTPPQGGTAFRVDRPAATPTAEPKAQKDAQPDGIVDKLTPDAKSAKIDKLATELLQYNPSLVKGFAILCQPIPADNFYTLDTATGIMSVHETMKAVQLSPREAQWLARALVDAEEAPQLKALNAVVTNVAKPYLPIASLVAGLGILGWHGYQAMKLRDAWLHDWNRAQSAAVENGAGPHTAEAPEPTAAETPSSEPVADPAQVNNLRDGGLANLREAV